MNIQKFSAMTHMSTYTIRYYEKIGLLKGIARNAKGHRYFTQQDIVWVEFIKRLKDTGMPLENIKQYADLRQRGELTSALRMEILQRHVVILEARIAEEQLHLKKLKDKIEYYDKIIN